MNITCVPESASFSAALGNRECLCVGIDRAAMEDALRAQLGEDADAVLAGEAWKNAFAHSAVFLPRESLDEMRASVRALERAAALPGYRQAVLTWAPSAAAIDAGPVGAFMGYDFHLGESGPRLIEINSNAGGAFLNAALARAQSSCCGAAGEEGWKSSFDEAVVAMFEKEWRRQRGDGRPENIAIVDDQPAEQYLHPEFLMARNLFRRHGIEADILAPEQLSHEDGGLFAGGKRIDMVYNRLVDFGLEAPAHKALRQAWLEGTAVLTPNPRVHALLADKRNLGILSETARLREWGFEEAEAALLDQVVPRTMPVQTQDAEVLWRDRRGLFFKPMAGHGGKGVYRGDKLTKTVFTEILQGGYVAQAYVPPTERKVLVDGEARQLKLDLRLYTYESEVLLACARLYRGQTTNFRTPGGGFAPLLLVNPSESRRGGRQ